MKNVIAEPKELIRIVKLLTIANENWKKMKTEIQLQILAIAQSPRCGDFVEKTKEAFSIFKEHENCIYSLLEAGEQATKKEAKNAVLLASFLWIYESYYVFCVDFFCRVFVFNGHDLFDLVKRKYVDSWEDIGDVDVSTKLKFLEAHNLGILARGQDRKLRNKIAHYNFSVDKFARIKVNGTMINIGQRGTELLGFTGKVMDTFYECLTKYVSDNKTSPLSKLIGKI
jgi:hypothetical protein